VTDADAVPAEPSSRTAWWRRLPEWLVAVCVGLFGAVIYVIPYAQFHTFYYVGDGPEGYAPNWYHFGLMLRDGQWPTMESASWFGGNYAAESATAIWNPLALLNNVIVSWFDDLAAAEAFVTIEYLALLAMGVYLLCREYGAGRVPAAVLGIALPISGFTLYYEAAGWPGGLFAFMAITWFWWAARRFSRKRLSPLVPFLIGVFAITTGSPYAALGIIIVVAGIGIELLARRDYRVLVHLVVLAACAGATCLLVFLPLVGTLEVSARQELAALHNDTFMVPDLGDLAASSAPSYLPSITNWGGAVLESLPSTYFIWFAIPLLPWLRWRSLRPAAKSMLSLAVITGIFGVLVLGPSNVWLFRWPIRLIEYLYLGLGVFLAVLLSAGLATDRWRQRTLATVVLVGVGAYMSFAVRPEYYGIHAVATLVVLLFCVGALLAYRRRGWVAAGSVLLLGTIAVVSYQTYKFPFRPDSGVTPFDPPQSVSRVQRGTAEFRGVVLQLAQQGRVQREDMADGKLLWGNETHMTGQEYINHYSGIGFVKLLTALCMDYKGVTCPDSYDRLWRSYGNTDVRLIDALRVETLVLENKLLPQVVNRQPPAGWRVLVRDDVRTVWLRQDPISYPGRISWATPGTELISAEARAQDERVSLRAPQGGGELVLARLAWPGYSATIDGRPAEVRNGEAGLITVSVPPGEHVLEVTYRTPGLRLGLTALGVAVIIVFAQSVMWWIGNRRRRDPQPPPERPSGSAEPSVDTENLATVKS
jgi:hypothetical protein